MIREEFARRFNEVTRAESNGAVARRIGCSPGYVSGVRHGNYVLGPALLEAFAREYRLELREWRRLAGHVSKEEETEERMVALAEAAALRAMAAVNGAERLARGIGDLSAKYGRAVPVYLEGGAGTLTVEEADRLLAEFDRQMAEETKPAESGGQAPLVLSAPSHGRRRTH